jgi:hypothetical protein
VVEIEPGFVVELGGLTTSSIEGLVGKFKDLSNQNF